MIGGLVERHHPGKKKSGRQVSFSTDLIYDVLRRYEPGHLLLRAAWDDARARMTELGRLVRLVDRASATMLHVEADRITPMAVPADGDRRPRGPSAGRARPTRACSSKLRHWPTKPCASDIAGSSRFCEAEHMKAFLSTCRRVPALRLRRRHRRRDRGRRRHAAGEGRVGRRRCRDHQPVGSRRKARPRAAQAGRGARAAGPGHGRALPQGTSASDGRLRAQPPTSAPAFAVSASS